MKLLFFGMGSIGKKHANIIRRLYHDDHEIIHFQRGQDISGYDVAFVCAPTNYHVPVAVRCINAGIKRIFMEKPIGTDLAQLNDLMGNVNGARVYVAYPFRHSHQVTSWQRTIPSKCTKAKLVCRTHIGDWLKPYGVHENTGGGATFELSHEIDLAAFLFGPIQSIRGSVCYDGNPFTRAETRARMMCEHPNHTTEIELDILSATRERFIEFDGLRIDTKVSEHMYVNQLRWYFDNIENSSNIVEAAEIFRNIVTFKERAAGCLH